MQSTVGPVKSVQMSYNAQGKTTGSATVLFRNKGDAHKAHASCEWASASLGSGGRSGILDATVKGRRHGADGRQQQDDRQPLVNFLWVLIAARGLSSLGGSRPRLLMGDGLSFANDSAGSNQSKAMGPPPLVEGVSNAAVRCRLGAAWERSRRRAETAREGSDRPCSAVMRIEPGGAELARRPTSPTRVEGALAGCLVMCPRRDETRSDETKSAPL